MSEQPNDRRPGGSAPDAPTTPQGAPGQGVPAWGTSSSPYASPEQYPPPPYTEPEAVGPTAPYPTAPPPGYEQVPPGAYPSSSAGWGLYPESSQAVLALVLGLIGVFVFQLVAPFAWVVANREIRAIDAGRRQPSSRGLAVAGKVLGIIGTIVLILEVVFLVIAVAIFVGAATSSSTAGP